MVWISYWIFFQGIDSSSLHSIFLISQSVITGIPAGDTEWQSVCLRCSLVPTQQYTLSLHLQCIRGLCADTILLLASGHLFFGIASFLVQCYNLMCMVNHWHLQQSSPVGSSSAMKSCTFKAFKVIEDWALAMSPEFYWRSITRELCVWECLICSITFCRVLCFSLMQLWLAPVELLHQCKRERSFRRVY